MGLLEGKTALITGAARGIGKAIALKFAEEGANIAFTDLNVNEETEAEIAAKGVKAKSYASNAADFAQTEEVVKQVKEEFGSIDILVNNAAQVTNTDILHCTEEEVLNVFKTNALSIILGIQTVMPEFEKLGKGAVVNVNSLAGIVSGDADGGSAPYSASKGAGRSLTKHAAYYLSSKNVRVNSVHPGPIATPMLEKALEENPAVAARVKEYNPLPPYVSGAEDVANAILFLASDEAACITGAELVVDCGHLVM